MYLDALGILCHRGIIVLVKAHLSFGISDLFVAMLYSYVSILLLFMINNFNSFAFFVYWYRWPKIKIRRSCLRSKIHGAKETQIRF